MKKIINGICVTLAFISLGIGSLGVVLPFLPTTPFLLLSCVLFAKGSTRFHQWFLSTRLYQEHVKEFVATKSMSFKTKITVLATVTILFGIGFYLSTIWHAKAMIAIIAIGHYYYFLCRIKTRKVSHKKSILV